MNRREFAYVTAIAGLVSGARRAESATGQAVKAPEVAGLITEMVFIDDCVRVAIYDRGVSVPAKTALTSHGDFVRNGVLAPAGSEARTAETFALAAGRSFSETLHRYRQPDSPEARLYQDIAVMRDLAAGAGCDAAKPGPVADLLDLLYVRRRMGLHTLNPGDEIQKWLEGVVVWWREQRDLRASLAAAYTAPDGSKMREFVAGFYRAEDPLIRLARRYQFGEVTPPDQFAAALDQARKGSRYAVALAQAVEALKKAPQPPA